MLRPLSTETSQNEYAVIDVETSEIKGGETPQTKFWGYADNIGYERFDSTKELVKFLRSKEPKTLLHHANFDVIQLLVDGADVRVLKSHNGKLIKCKLGKHLTLNTFASFPVSMKSIFKAYGFQKTSLSKLVKRNYEDCVNGLHCFLDLDSQFRRLCGVSPLSKGTIAGTGFGAAELFAGKMPKDLSFLESFRGGRVEVWDTNKMVASNYDIHSSYPKSFIEASQKEQLWHVQVRTKDYWGPLFAENENEMLLFPNGNFTSWVYKSNWEKYIETNCCQTKIKIISRHNFDFGWICELKDLILEIYAKKQSSTGAIQLVCKLLLNSLYGRIGLKGESERCRVLNYRADGDDISCHYISRGRWLTFDKVLREPRSNYPFAAYITDNARARLYAAVVRNGPAYGDTDSIFTRNEKFRGKIGEACGEWGNNGRKLFRAQNVKDYRFGSKIVRKGGDEHTIWSIKRFAKHLPALHVVRHRLQGLRKRLVMPDGTTEPLTIGE